MSARSAIFFDSSSPPVLRTSSCTMSQPWLRMKSSFARQAENSAGHAAYDPPCPRNQDHAYRFTVYALDSVLSLPNGASLKTAWMAIARAAIARGRLDANVEP